MNHIRRFLSSVHNLIRWFPVIWKDKDWDQSYLYTIMLTKIRHMRERNEKVKFYVGHEIDAKWMKVCERLIENLVESKYWDDEYDHKPLNIKNMTFDDPIYQGMVRAYKSGFPQEIREMKARKLLFKILEWRIEYWWD